MANTSRTTNLSFSGYLSVLLLFISVLLSSDKASASSGATETYGISPQSRLLLHRPADHPSDLRAGYFIGLLKLALDKTEDDYGPYELIARDEPINQERSFVMVSQNKLDVTWGMTSNMRELKTRPIRIPLMKGLLGYRVMLINQQRAAELSQVVTKAALTDYVMVQGNGWPDTEILKNNGFKVRTQTQYVGLFEMLRKNRVDLFPRSIAEVWLELDQDISFGLMLKQDLVLQYVSPIYFFVPREREFLAERIETGLERAISDGSFDHYFQSRPELKKALNLLNNTDYTLIRLKDPELHPKTPLNRAELWFKPAGIR